MFLDVAYYYIYQKLTDLILSTCKYGLNVVKSKIEFSSLVDIV